MAYEISPDIGLRYWDFASDEFLRIVDGWQRRKEGEWERMAWLASHLLAAWTSSAPTVDTLLGGEYMAAKKARIRRMFPQADSVEDDDSQAVQS